MNIKPPLPTEHQEQGALFYWAMLQSKKYPMLNGMFAIPNGGKRAYKTAVDLKAEGVKPGVSDIMLPYSDGKYHGLFIEMKRIKKGMLSDEQIEFINLVRNNGYAACVCCGFEEARDTILLYIKGGYENNDFAVDCRKGK